MKKLLLLTLVLALTIFRTNADHYSGAEITYECTGGNNYTVTLTVYRDCAGQILDNFYELDYSSSCQSGVLRVDAIGPLEEITPSLNCGIVTRCTDPTSPYLGRQRRIYQGDITLPACAGDYTFSWIKNFRNTVSISNVVGSNQRIYTEMVFNNTVKACNSSFTFGASLMNRTICAGEFFSFDFSQAMINPDGDSVYYELVSPLIGSGGSLLYESGFSFANPIATQSGFNFNNNTGLLEFTSANVVQSSIVAVKIYEYDSAGNLIGYTIRDMQIIIEDCNNTAPQITGINGTQEDTIYMCGGQLNCFEVYIDDVEGDNLLLNYTVTPSIPNGPTVGRVLNTTSSAYYRICFNPDTTGTYTINLDVNDRHCPDTLTDTRTITIIVPNDSLFQCECSNVNFTYDNVCPGTATTFNGVAQLAPGRTVSSWVWDFGDGTAAGSGPTPSHTYAVSGTYDVVVTITDDQGCVKTSTSTLRICAPPSLGFIYLDSCQVAGGVPNPVIFQDTSGSECTIFRRAWDFGDGSTAPFSSSISGSHGYALPGVFTVQMMIEYGDPNAVTRCYDSTTLNLTIYPKPTFTIHPDDFLQSCAPNYDTIYTVIPGDTSHSIQWFINGATVSGSLGGNNDSLDVNTFGLTIDTFRLRNINIRVLVEDSLGCYEDSIRIISDPITPRFLNTPYCEPGDTITFWDLSQITGSLQYSFLDRVWDFGDPNAPSASSSDSVTQHYYSVEDIYRAELLVFDTDSCFDYAARPFVKVVLPDDDFNVFASGDPNRDNDTICFNTQSVIMEGPNEDRASIDKYVWYLDDATIDSVELVNLYNGTWLMNVFGPTGRTFHSGKRLTHRYAATDFGIKHISMKMIYNTIRDSQGTLVDSLYCVRYFYDTIDIRPPQVLDAQLANHCIYEQIELDANQVSGDNIVSWFVDFGDSSIVSGFDTAWSQQDTMSFGAGSSIDTFYLYSSFNYPDVGQRFIEITVIDEFGCTEVLQIDTLQIIKLDTQNVNNINFCDNKAIQFLPNDPVRDGTGNIIDWIWSDDFNTIGRLHWDFGDPTTTDDTVLVNITSSDTLSYLYPTDSFYYVTITATSSNYNCQTVFVDTILVQPTPDADLLVPGISCVGSPVEFVEKSSLFGQWLKTGTSVEDSILSWTLHVDGDTLVMTDALNTLNGDSTDIVGFESGNTYTHTYSTSYYDTVTLYIQSSNGCSGRDTVVSYMAPYPIANFGCLPSLPGPTSTITFLDSTNWIEDDILHPDSSHTWTLTNDDGEFVFGEVGYDLDEIVWDVTEEDIYFMELIVRNEYNCTDTARKEVDSYAYLDCPTAFSPTESGDERNNAFRLHHKGFVEVIEYRIFNRYGEAVFDSKDLNETWDGNYKGKLQETGMYVVLVRAVDVLGREKQLYKNVLLVR